VTVIRRAGAIALAGALTLGACGTTYIDSEITVPDTSPDATVVTLAPIDTNAPLDELLTDIEQLMTGLDEQIIEQDGEFRSLERINELWAVAEPQIRAIDPNDVFNFEQTIELARSGVERRRPADASKGLKLLADVLDAYLDRV
jgi:hypothetical protein